jgi:hypothetical protein
MVGYVLGLSVGFLLGHILLGNVMVGMAIGAGVGYFQWLLLRRYVPRSSFWIVDCVAGMTVALALYSVVSTVWGYPFDLGVPHGVVGWGVAFLVAGGFAGVFQYRILRRTIPRSLAWVPASAVAWGLSVAGLAIPPEMDQPMPVWMLFPRNLFLPPAAAGLILGIITGFVIIAVLKSAAPARVDEQGGA